MLPIFDLTFINTSILTNISNTNGNVEDTFLLCILLSIISLIPTNFINHYKIMWYTLWIYKFCIFNLLMLQGGSTWILFSTCNSVIIHMLNSLITDQGFNKNSNLNKLWFQSSCIIYLDTLWILMYTIQDLFILYCLLEVAVITILLPVISMTGDKGSKTLALEYFIINLLVNFFGWIGLMGLYSILSTLDMLTIQINLMYLSEFISEFLLIIFFFLVILMVFIKLALVPFHSWALILYTKLNSYAFLMLMGPFKIIYWTLFFILFDIIWMNGNIYISAWILLFFCGFIIYFLGLLLTAGQLKLKSFFIVSSSIYSGTYLMGISFITSWDNSFMTNLQMYLSVYLIATFYVLSILVKQGGLIITFSDCNKYLNYQEKTFISLYFGLFLGLPPFISFFFKYLLTSYLIINASIAMPLIACCIYIWYWFTLLPYSYYFWQLFIVLVW